MAQPARRLYARPGLSQLRSLQIPDRGMLGLLLLGTAAAGWPTLSSLLPYTRGDTPLSFVALVPLLGSAYALSLFDSDSIRSQYHDVLTDGIPFVLLLVGAGIFLLVLPVTMGWYYWLDRLDVPGLVLLLMALIALTWGLPALKRLLPALLYLFLAWPLPWLFVNNHIVPPFTQLTAWVVRHIVTVLPLGIAGDPANGAALLVQFHGHTSRLVVDQACSGANGALGLVVLALPVALLALGTSSARAAWLFAGVVLSWLVNVLRMVIIAVGSTIWGPGPTFSLLHPEIGLIFFGLSFALLLALAPRFGLDLTPVWKRLAFVKTPEEGSPAQTPSWGLRRLVALGLLLAAGGLAESNLVQFNWLSDSNLPRVSLTRARDLFRPPPGWHTTRAQYLPNWTPFFGASSTASVMTITGHHQPAVDVQAVLTRDRSTFDAYSVENCYTFHGYTLQSVHRVTLGSGITATLIDFRTKHLPLAALYWVQPVKTPQGTYHRRVILIAGQHGQPAPDVAREAPVQGVVPPVQTIATTLADLLSPWLGSQPGAVYSSSNAELRSLGQRVVADERRQSTAR